MNKLTIIGNLTRDPELRSVNGRDGTVSVCDFTVAVNRNFRSKSGEEPQADFLNVTAWRQTAEFVTRYFRKASSICVVGSLQTRSWVDQNGQKRFATEVVADEAYFVDAKSESPLAVQQAAAANFQNNPAPSYIPEGYGNLQNTAGAAFQNQGTPKFEETDDDELPF